MKDQLISLLTNVKVVVGTVLSIAGLIALILSFDARYVHAITDTQYEQQQNKEIDQKVEMDAQTALSSMLLYREQMIQQQIKYLETKKAENRGRLSSSDQMWLDDLRRDLERARNDSKKFR